MDRDKGEGQGIVTRARVGARTRAMITLILTLTLPHPSPIRLHIHAVTTDIATPGPEFAMSGASASVPDSPYWPSSNPSSNLIPNFQSRKGVGVEIQYGIFVGSLQEVCRKSAGSLQEGGAGRGCRKGVPMVWLAGSVAGRGSCDCRKEFLRGSCDLGNVYLTSFGGLRAKKKSWVDFKGHEVISFPLVWFLSL